MQNPNGEFSALEMQCAEWLFPKLDQMSAAQIAEFRRLITVAGGKGKTRLTGAELNAMLDAAMKVQVAVTA